MRESALTSSEHNSPMHTRLCHSQPVTVVQMLLARHAKKMAVLIGHLLSKTLHNYRVRPERNKDISFSFFI